MVYGAVRDRGAVWQSGMGWVEPLRIKGMVGIQGFSCGAGTLVISARRLLVSL